MRSPRSSLCGLLLLFAAVGGGAAKAASDASGTDAPRATVAIPRTSELDFTSALNGHRYRIQIAIPFLPPPAGGYPVVYVLDAAQFFGTVTEASRFRSLGGDLGAAVIVGITYPDPSTFRSNGIRRSFDLTPTIDRAASQVLKSAYGVAPETGGAAQFHQIVETEIKPRVARLVPVDAARSILLGHSFGGLFALYVMFHHPEAYKTYLALSPSIWWGQRAVLDGEAGFARRVAAHEVAPRLFIGVGAGEQTSRAAAGPGDPATASADDYRMVDNVVDLAGRLGRLDRAAGFELKSKIYDRRSHVGVYWAAIDDLLDFALSPGR